MGIQAEILRRVRQALPDFMGLHCRHCVVRDERLLIYMDSPAFASQLRFYAPSLLEKLDVGSGPRIRDIQVRNLLAVAPEPGSSQPKPRNARSSASGEALVAAAEGMASEEIKAALLRLGRTLRGAG
jgi:hypothetical protein